MAKPAGVQPEMDAYQQWLAAKQNQQIAQTLADNSASRQPLSIDDGGLKLDAPTFGEQKPLDFDFSGSEKLAIAPEFDPATPVEYQAISSPSMTTTGGISTGDAGGMSAGSMAGAGVAAAGQAVSIIAQIAGQQAAKEQMLAANEANRASSEKMARASLLQNQSQFDSNSQMSAYQSMLSMLDNASSQTMQQRALKRANTQTRGDGLTTAFLGA